MMFPSSQVNVCSLLNHHHTHFLRYPLPFLPSMFSLMLSTAARTACRGTLSPNLAFTRAGQRLHLPTSPSHQLLRFSRKNPTRLSANLSFKSKFSTSALQAQDTKKAIETATTAPIPAAPVQPAFWESLGPLTQFFRWYGRSNTQRPYLTQFLSSLAIFCTGDLAAQYFGGEEYDYKRTLRILAISAGSSIVIFKWSVPAQAGSTYLKNKLRMQEGSC